MQERRRLWVRIFCCLLPFGVMALIAAQAAAVSSHHWSIKGELSEACTCQVPCGCNFHQGPSPHHYCWSLASFQIDKGHYGGVDLAGLRLVRAHGGKSIVWYIDGRATAQQAEALRAIAAHVTGGAWVSKLPDGLHFESANIAQDIGNKSFQIKIGDKGGFEANKIMGGDGKNPIVVENMTAWNVRHDIKGKTTRLYYKDEFGNRFDLTGTNANEGKFDWTDTTPNYF
ncbi:MAG: DUF1326 domain-containing protein [Terriglobia bacterium]